MSFEEDNYITSTKSIKMLKPFVTTKNIRLIDELRIEIMSESIQLMTAGHKMNYSISNNQ